MLITLSYLENTMSSQQTVIGTSSSAVNEPATIIGAQTASTATPNKYATLSWEQKLQIHSNFFSTVAHSAKVFGVSAATFRKYRDQFKADANFDCASYASDFAARASHDAAGNIIPKPRGRQTNKIVTAFNSVGYDPVPLDTFCETHGISSHVMTQRSRFDKSDKNLNVVCRKINGVSHIMRLTETQMTERAEKMTKRTTTTTPAETDTTVSA